MSSEQATSTSPGLQGTSEAEYGASYYSHYWGGGGPYERNERWLKFFGDLADGLIRDLHPTSVLDAGCAMGFLVEGLHKRGVEAAGIDVSEYAISQVHESVAKHCSVATLTAPIEGHYDLITCIEVIEHVPAAETDVVIANLCAATDRLVLSTTPEDFGEPTHLNVQPPEAWSAKLAQEGFLRDLDHDLSYISPWAALYTRQQEPREETVRRYDRAWWRLRREVLEVRESLLQSQEQLAQLEDQGDPDAAAEMQAELDRRNVEILRLRDLLVGMDRELGAALGYRTQLEDRALRLETAKRRVEGGIPVFGKLLGKLYRLIRRAG